MTNVPPTENFVRFGHAGFDRHTGIHTDRHELTLAIKGDARNIFERQLIKDIY